MSCNDTDIGDTTVIPTENIKQIKFVRWFFNQTMQVI
jgi:hypothetical protein